MKRSRFSLSFSEDDSEIQDDSVKLSEFINTLTKVKNQYGDIPLCAATNDCISTIQPEEILLKIIKRADYDVQINMESANYLSISFGF
jgi:hypothetical protein